MPQFQPLIIYILKNKYIFISSELKCKNLKSENFGEISWY